MKKLIGFLGLVSLSITTSCVVLNLTHADAASRRKSKTSSKKATTDAVTLPPFLAPCTTSVPSIGTGVISPSIGMTTWFFQGQAIVACKPLCNSCALPCVYLGTLWVWQNTGTIDNPFWGVPSRTNDPQAGTLGTQFSWCGSNGLTSVSKPMQPVAGGEWCIQYAVYDSYGNTLALSDKFFFST